jgi:hypothetical protein
MIMRRCNLYIKKVPIMHYVKDKTWTYLKMAAARTIKYASWTWLLVWFCLSNPWISNMRTNRINGRPWGSNITTLSLIADQILPWLVNVSHNAFIFASITYLLIWIEWRGKFQMVDQGGNGLENGKRNKCCHA